MVLKFDMFDVFTDLRDRRGSFNVLMVNIFTSYNRLLR